jgi:hypothetical protein
MASLAWIVGIIGAICTVVGIITAIEWLSFPLPALTAMFWLALAGVLFLAAIATSIASRQYD